MGDDTWIKGEISRKILKYFELNENKNTTYYDVRNAAKQCLEGNL